MLPRLQALFGLGACVVSTAALAQETTDEPAPPDSPPPTGADTPTEDELEGWHTEVHGYFRAPMALGISSRENPDNPTGPKHRQVSYGPNRTVDSSYFSFAYTRLQEQDWAEVFIHEKKKHVDAAVGWMGYWYQAAGFRNPDASWVPAAAYLTLDTDFELDGLKPNIALTMGAWWPGFGSFPKYDTYTIGRFRQIGEQLTFKVALSPDFSLASVQGFGTARDGSFNYGAPPFYGAQTGLDLIMWGMIQFSYQEYVEFGIHFNSEWTSDPNLAQGSMIGDKSYTVVRAARLSTIGYELTLRAPYAGRLWISWSVIDVVNGWALANGGTEVMHSLGGAGIATNYMAYTGAPDDSTGSGSMFNLGFLYENTLSGIQGKAPGALPEVTLNLFGLLTSASLDLPAGSTLTRDSIRQLKLGADVTLQAIHWLGVMLRYDTVNYDLDNPAYVFSAITGRVSVSSHWLSSERIYLQYSRYIYGDKMVLNASWPWGTPLVAGSNVLQQGPYSGKTPDENIVRLQADIAF